MVLVVISGELGAVSFKRAGVIRVLGTNRRLFIIGIQNGQWRICNAKAAYWYALFSFLLFAPV